MSNTDINPEELEELDVDAFLNGLSAREAYIKEHPIRSIPRKIQQFWWTICRVAGDATSNSKWGLQRMFRGHDDTDVWGYKHSNAERTITLLTKLKENKHGVPFMMHNAATFDEQTRAWDAVLDTMIDGFQSVIDESNVFIINKNGRYNPKKSNAERKRCQVRFRKGMKAYTTYYHALWD